MKSNKIIFIDSVHPILRERLTQMGFKCLDYTGNSRQEILSVISTFTGAVIRSKFKIDKEILKAKKRFGEKFDKEQFVITNPRVVGYKEKIATISEDYMQ